MVGPLHCILQIERQGDRTEKAELQDTIPEFRIGII